MNILQAKFRKKLGKHLEGRNDVKGLLELADILDSDDDERQKTFLQGLDARITRKVNAAIKRVKEDNYNVNLFFVTTGKISNKLKEEAEKIARKHNADYMIHDHKSIQQIWEDWLDMVAPAPPDYDLPIEMSRYGKHLYRKDSKRNIETWIVTVSSKEIEKMVEYEKKQLFATNIRGFLGEDTPMNKSMIETLNDDPEDFWYYNNGITMVCNKCREFTENAITKLHLERPQIVNGQQTARALAKHPHSLAHVVMKVIRIPRFSSKGDNTDYSQMIADLVKATNWQNKIGYEDLVSNDQIQIHLEREFKHRRYQYVRKREKKSEARGRIRFRPILQIGKVELAKSVAACVLDPSIGRKSKDYLFDGDYYYKKIFDKSDANFYLSCFHVYKFVDHYHYYSVPRKNKSSYSGSLIIHLIWDSLADQISSGEGAMRFRELWRRKNQKKYDKTMKKMVQLGYQMTKKFYMENRKDKDGAEIDERQIYARDRLWKTFSTYAKTKDKKAWREFKGHVDELKKELKKIELK